MPREKMFHQSINPFVLAAGELAILIEREVLGPANFSRLSECAIGLLKDSI